MEKWLYGILPFELSKIQYETEPAHGNYSASFSLP